MRDQGITPIFTDETLLCRIDEGEGNTDMLARRRRVSSYKGSTNPKTKILLSTLVEMSGTRQKLASFECEKENDKKDRDASEESGKDSIQG